jgi:tRNA (guanine37-N1)-methyltransferase
MQGLVDKGTVSLEPYDLTLDYGHWTYGTAMSPASLLLPANIVTAEIIASVLPEDLMDDMPQGFTQVGHVCMLISVLCDEPR